MGLIKNVSNPSLHTPSRPSLLQPLLLLLSFPTRHFFLALSFSIFSLFFSFCLFLSFACSLAHSLYLSRSFSYLNSARERDNFFSRMTKYLLTFESIELPKTSRCIFSKVIKVKIAEPWFLILFMEILPIEIEKEREKDSNYEKIN